MSVTGRDSSSSYGTRGAALNYSATIVFPAKDEPWFVRADVPGPGGTAEPIDLESLDPSHRNDSASAIFKCASCGSLIVLSTHRGNQVDLHMSVYQRMIPGELN